LEQAHPDDDLKPWNATERTKTKTEPPLFPLLDEFTDTGTLALQGKEWSTNVIILGYVQYAIWRALFRVITGQKCCILPILAFQSVAESRTWS
jgi:hypothetical protein